MAVHYREYLNLPQGAVGRKRWASTESRQAHVRRLCADTHVVYQVSQRCMLCGPISPSVRRLCADTLTSASTCGSPIDSIQPHAVSRAALCDARYAGRPQLVLTALRRDLVDSLEHARHIVVDVQDPVAGGPRQVLLLSAKQGKHHATFSIEAKQAGVRAQRQRRTCGSVAASADCCEPCAAMAACDWSLGSTVDLLTACSECAAYHAALPDGCTAAEWHTHSTVR